MVEKSEDGNGKPRYESIASNDMLDIITFRRSRYGETQAPASIMTHARSNPDQRAIFAMACIEKWAMVAGQLDGEDSAGRSRMRRMTPEEVVEHACACTEKAFAEFQSRGWLLSVPAYSDLVDKVKEQENNND